MSRFEQRVIECDGCGSKTVTRLDASYDVHGWLQIQVNYGLGLSSEQAGKCFDFCSSKCAANLFLKDNNERA